ncbi:hypothetical protein HGA92_01625 [Candidatus Gracilibacteria bacterium]|nr:hypothetical protein [Candidatus Gracilibacteria bacterium]NUJ98691.1 hypothetical protein [Candidatus Gracilibacteria bacterium]
MEVVEQLDLFPNHRKVHFVAENVNTLIQGCFQIHFNSPKDVSGEYFVLINKRNEIIKQGKNYKGIFMIRHKKEDGEIKEFEVSVSFKTKQQQIKKWDSPNEDPTTNTTFENIKIDKIILQDGKVFLGEELAIYKKRTDELKIVLHHLLIKIERGLLVINGCDLIR